MTAAWHVHFYAACKFNTNSTTYWVVVSKNFRKEVLVGNGVCRQRPEAVETVGISGRGPKVLKCAGPRLVQRSFFEYRDRSTKWVTEVSEYALR